MELTWKELGLYDAVVFDNDGKILGATSLNISGTTAAHVGGALIGDYINITSAKAAVEKKLQTLTSARKSK